MKITNSQSAVVLAHDAFTQYGGAERVFEATHELFPEAPVYTFAVDKNIAPRLKGWNLRISPLQKVYTLYPHLTHLFALMPIMLEFWKPERAKVLLSFSSFFMKSIRKPEGAFHINYCHTPTRFLWVDPEWAYKEILFPLRWIAKIYFGFLRRWELSSVKNIDLFVANSKEVQKRIKEVYNRDSEIIYPFVDVKFWKPAGEKKNYFLIAGRLQYAKGLDTVVEAFNTLGWDLHVVGTGRYEQALKNMAKPNVKFFGRLSDEDLRDQFSQAKGYIYPQFEDFGMMPLEAAACGTATIGLARGGSLETIIPGQTGELLSSITSESLVEALKYWDHTKYDQSILLEHAGRFSKEIFQQKIKAIVDNHS